MGPRGVNFLYTVFYFWARMTSGKPKPSSWGHLSHQEARRQTALPILAQVLWPGPFSHHKKIKAEIIDLRS